MLTLKTVPMVLILLLGGCSTDLPDEPIAGGKRDIPLVAGSTSPSQVKVTRTTTEGPERCSSSQVGETVTNFFAALNRGDVHAVMDAFTDKLGWYSVTEGDPDKRGRHFVSYNPTKLRSYFKDRVRHNERLYLLEIDVAYERPGNLAHVAYDILRSADDLKGLAPNAIGKGAIDCDTGRITVWSMAHRQESTPGSLCPGEPDPPTVAIVCARL
jgi:ketosteroid isomerase-like protein